MSYWFQAHYDGKTNLVGSIDITLELQEGHSIVKTMERYL